MYTETTWYELS